MKEARGSTANTGGYFNSTHGSSGFDSYQRPKTAENTGHRFKGRVR